MGVISLNADLSEFRAALRKVRDTTKKAEVDIVNGALKDVAFRAASFTPKANPNKIEAGLLKDKIALKMATTRLKQQSGSIGGKRVTRKLVAMRARQLIARRKKVVGYARAGWFPAIKALGGSIRGSIRGSGGARVISPPSKLGTASLATANKMFGEIVNLVYDKMKGKAAGHSRAVMERALQEAIQFVTRDKEAYAQTKINAILEKHSD